MQPRNGEIKRVVCHPFFAVGECDHDLSEIGRFAPASSPTRPQQEGGTLKRIRDNALRLVALIWLIALTGCGEKAVGESKSSEPNPQVLVSTAWPMTRGGPALSGNIAAELPMSPNTAWTFKAASAITGEPSISSGRVFVGTLAGVLHCLSADSGQELWQFTTQETVSAAPAVTSDRVYLSSNDGVLYALNAVDGAEVWRFTIEEKISSGAIVVKNPTGQGDWVLVNGYDGTTRVLNSTDGKVIWTYQTQDFINGSPAIVDGRWVVFGGCDAQLHVVNLTDGSLVHQIPANAYIPSSIATFGTMAFCGNYANETVAFDVAAGTVAWVYKDRALPFFSSPAVNERLVLIGSRDKHLHAINRKTGEGAWKFRTGGRVEGAPIVFEDGVVFGSSDGRLYAASLETGTELWQLDLGESLVASPAYGENQIVIGGENGTVFALRAEAPKNK
jgi:outer membrane protein assembly factor BamB